MVVVNDEEFLSLPGLIAILRAAHAQARGDVSGTAKNAGRALDLLPEGDLFFRGAAAPLLGIAYWAGEDLEAAHRSVTVGIASLQTSGDISSAIGARSLLANLRMAQGRLREAAATCQRALQLAAEQGEPVPPGTAEVYVELGELNRERGDPEAAAQHLLRSTQLGDHPTLELRHRWSIAMARLKHAQGDLGGALELLEQEERKYVGGAIPDLRPVAALKTRVWIEQGRLAEARTWATERSLSPDDDLTYMREFEHITLARVLIAQYSSEQRESTIHEALGLLERLLTAAEEGERTGSVIEILLLRALAHEAHGDVPTGLAQLERALTLAEPEGYVRIFVDEGEPMRELLRHAAAASISSSYTRRLLSAFDGRGQPISTAARVAATDLPEPLTAREVEIVRLVAAGMRNQEIADQLVISVSTVKRHLANTYGKLGVGYRTEAVARADELGLL